MDKYCNILQKLNNVAVFRKDRATLRNMRTITGLLGNPQDEMKFIHIAGTNGKGSVTLKMCKLMQQIGDCGCFTSPHISNFRERIKINDEMIPQTYVIDNLNYLFEIAQKNNLELTFFEYVTALALKYYKDVGIKYIAWETGLGGRMDSTNIINSSLVSIITTIGLDHMHILGSSIELIAKEKAGIIKPHCPVVLGPNCQPLQTFVDEANKNHSKLHIVEGKYQTFNDENNAIVRQAAAVLQNQHGFQFKDLETILSVQQPCRLEKFTISNIHRKQVNIYLDVGHNEQAIRRVLGQLQPLNITCIYGASKDKDVETCLQLLLVNCDKVYMVEAKVDRAFKINQSKFSQAKIIHNGDIIKTVQEVVNEIIEPNHVVLVIGSFYIMSDARKALELKDAENNCDFQS